MYDLYLAHYGILGMKWGIRRYQPYSGRGRKSGKEGKEIGEARERSNGNKKKVDHDELIRSVDPQFVYKHKNELSDKELIDRLNRIRNEDQLWQLANSKKSKKKTIMKKIANRVDDAIVTAIAGFVISQGKDLVKYYGPAIWDVLLSSLG